MGEENTTPARSFEGEFKRRLSEIIERGSACGLNISQLCREAGVSRATPDRWRTDVPLSVRLVDQLDAVVTRHELVAKKAAE